MAGFDYDKAKLLNIPDVFQVEAMIAIGVKVEKENLPDNLQKRKIPSGEKSLKEIVFVGEFRNIIK